MLRLCSFAKINLDLRVLDKRPDGFHELRTVFQTVSLADTIEVDYQPGPTRIEISGVSIPDNLIERATHAVLEATGATGRFYYRVTKRIPVGGGLGGGSSNAAAVLLAAPALLGRTLPLESAMELAADLGSDVPFFLLGGAAVGIGRGTEVYPLPDLLPCFALLVTPQISVSTADAYRALKRELTNGLRGRNTKSFQAFAWTLCEHSPDRNWGSENDFESAVFTEHPRLAVLKTRLLELGARPALLTGSGSTLFGLFESSTKRNAALDSLRVDLGTEAVYPARFVSRRCFRRIWRAQLRSK